MIVAGTNKANRAPKIAETVSPTPIPIIEPITLSIPNLLTITRMAPDKRKVCESLLFPIFTKNPTNNPRRTRIA